MLLNKRPSLPGLLCRVAAIMVAALPVPVYAGTNTSALAVQLAITASCTISTGTLNFGTVLGTSLLTLATSGQTTISVTCTNSSPYSVAMDNGANASGSQRRLSNGSAYINYGLYTDALFQNPWTTASTSTSCTGANSCYLGTGNGVAQTINIYGQVPLVALAPASGTYSDTVTMTITY